MGQEILCKNEKIWYSCFVLNWVIYVLCLCIGKVSAHNCYPTGLKRSHTHNTGIPPLSLLSPQPVYNSFDTAYDRII